MVRNSMANRLLNLLLLLMMTSTQSVTSLESEASRVLVAASYPSIRIGPNDFRYFRVEVRRAFAELSISLTRKWAGEHVGTTTRAMCQWFASGSDPAETPLQNSAFSAAMANLPSSDGAVHNNAVHNSNNNDLEFDLSWHLESYSHEAAINPMERVLVEGARESPFNSSYGPTTRKEGVVTLQPWFTLSEMAHIENTTTGNWSYFFIEVPRGAAGAVLSVQLRHVVPQQATMSVYARLEGFATPDCYDAKIVNKEKLSLDLVYPAEGTWCIGVHYLKHVAAKLEEDDTESSTGTAHLSSSFVHWFHKLVDRFRSSHNTASETAIATTNKEVGFGPSMNESGGPLTLSKRWDLRSIQMQINVHGCVNKCSGKGHCVTTHDASRLHFISFCGCDAAHGGVDCSVSLLVPREEVLHVLDPMLLRFYPVFGPYDIKNVALLCLYIWHIQNGCRMLQVGCQVAYTIHVMLVVDAFFLTTLSSSWIFGFHLWW